MFSAATGGRIRRRRVNGRRTIRTTRISRRFREDALILLVLGRCGLCCGRRRLPGFRPRAARRRDGDPDANRLGALPDRSEHHRRGRAALVVERLPKDEYIRVDDRHIRSSDHRPAGRVLQGRRQVLLRLHATSATRRRQAIDAALHGADAAAASRRPRPATTPTPSGRPRCRLRGHLTRRASPDGSGSSRSTATGLAASGLWRASFVVARRQRGRNPGHRRAAVAPGRREAAHLDRRRQGRLHAPGRCSSSRTAKPNLAFSIDYGARRRRRHRRGRKHGHRHARRTAAGLVSLFGDGKGRFASCGTGLPQRDFSAQAIALLDADGDGKLDIVASRRRPITGATTSAGRRSASTSIAARAGGSTRRTVSLGGFYSNSLHAWDFDRRRPEGRADGRATSSAR